MTFTEMLSARGANPADYAEVIKAHGEEISSKSNPFDDGRYIVTYWKRMYDVMPFDGGVVVLYGKTKEEQGRQRTFVSVGHEIVYLKKDGGTMWLGHLVCPTPRKERWEDTRDYKNKILSVEVVDGHWNVVLGKEN